MTAWIWPITPENYGVLKQHGHSFIDFKKPTRKVQRVRAGDGVAVYLTRRKGVAAILEVVSSLYQRQPPTPVWTDEVQAGRVLYPLRFDARLVRAGWADFRPLWQQLQSPDPKLKAMGWRGLGPYVRGVVLQEISSGDLSLIDAALAGAAVTPPAAVSRSPVSPPQPASKQPATAAPSAALPKKRVFGPPLNFRELRHEPINEQGVVYLFGMTARELGFLVEGIGTGYPDCSAKRRTSGGLYEPVNIEFEFRASNFQQHGHDPKGCDLIVCWENDWPSCPIDVLELKEEIKKFP